MLQQIRKIFLTQYIGAIVIALLLVDVVTSAVAMVGGIVTWRFTRRSASAVIESYPDVDWGVVIIPHAVRVILYSIVAYALLRWLYLRAEPEADEGDEIAERQQPSGETNVP